MSLTEWELRKSTDTAKDKFSQFQEKFVAYLANPTDYTYVKQCVIDEKVWQNFEEEHKAKSIPADLCLIRDNDMSTNDCVLDVWRSTTDYTKYNIEV